MTLAYIYQLVQTYFLACTLASASASLMPRRMESWRMAMCFSRVWVPQECSSWFRNSHDCLRIRLDLLAMLLVTMGMRRFVWTYWKGKEHAVRHKPSSYGFWSSQNILGNLHSSFFSLFLHPLTFTGTYSSAHVTSSSISHTHRNLFFCSCHL